MARGFVAIPLLFAIWSLYLLLGLKEGGWVGNTGQLPSAPGNTTLAGPDWTGLILVRSGLKFWDQTVVQFPKKLGLDCVTVCTAV